MGFAEAIDAIVEALKSFAESIAAFIEALPMNPTTRRYTTTDNAEWIDQKSGRVGEWMAVTRSSG